MFSTSSCVAVLTRTFPQLTQFPESLKEINQSLKLNPNYFKALLARARIYVGLQLHESAMEDFQAALEHGTSKMNPKDLLGVQAELEVVKQTALQERKKKKDYYKILGVVVVIDDQYRIY
jgi:DnaJ family protein C protein 7